MGREGRWTSWEPSLMSDDKKHILASPPSYTLIKLWKELRVYFYLLKVNSTKLVRINVKVRNSV